MGLLLAEAAEQAGAEQATFADGGISLEAAWGCFCRSHHRGRGRSSPIAGQVQQCFNLTAPTPGSWRMRLRTLTGDSSPCGCASLLAAPKSAVVLASCFNQSFVNPKNVLANQKHVLQCIWGEASPGLQVKKAV
jgi:hypothetical protein